ncbi:hypothetical protein AVEN_145976-1 [Araneus ventricosus]|uniref:Uncharacterized protein n=1 Tax=Araneus ventricosus TaxID=182803 RepID=A0A4Y2TSD4_ARAVE|nr:hypothetical protein AVEN_145976-1 [Araneus ventricosus]
MMAGIPCTPRHKSNVATHRSIDPPKKDAEPENLQPFPVATIDSIGLSTHARALFSLCIQPPGQPHSLPCHTRSESSVQAPAAPLISLCTTADKL